MKAILAPILQKLSFLKTKGVKQVLTYLLSIFILFFALIYVDGFLSRFETRLHLMGFMVAAILIGVVNNMVLGKSLYDNIPIWMKSLLTVSANTVGMAFFMTFSSSHSIILFNMLFLFSLALFSFPWFFIATIQAILSIPELTYQPCLLYTSPSPRD